MKKLIFALCFVSLQIQHSHSQGALPQIVIAGENWQGRRRGDLKTGEVQLKKIYGHVEKYKARHSGSLPSGRSPMSSLLRDMLFNFKEYGFDSASSVLASLTNQGTKNVYDSDTFPQSKNLIPYVLRDKRLDGTSVGESYLAGLRDPIAWTSIYQNTYSVKMDNGNYLPVTVGGWLVLWQDGRVEDIPYDCLVYMSQAGAFTQVIPGEYGVKEETVNYSEYWKKVVGLQGPILSKPHRDLEYQIFEDNGGPESLVQLSRRQSYPNRYGIDREKLWQTFDPAQPELTLEQVQTGAQSLGLSTRLEKVSLSRLEQANSAALLFLKDDGRIVTLLALDDDRAVLVDRGVTRNVSRQILENRYSGEALLPTTTPAVLAQDGVREVRLPSYQTESAQQVVLRNTSDKTVPLQLDHPLLGVTEAKLSKEVLAPGETATLDLKMKWRTILKAPTQNVLVSLSHGENQPRTQLAFLLVPPPGEKAPEPQYAPPAGAQASALPRAEDNPANQIGQARPTVKTGDQAPAFTATDMNGKTWKLADLKGQKSVLLTFFPKCFTGGCANHLSGLRDKQSEFEALGVQILGVSVDGAGGEKGQLAFAKQWQLGFPLVPDENRALSRLFGAVQTDSQLAARMSVLIDKNGVVRLVETNVPLGEHGAQMLEKIKALS